MDKKYIVLDGTFAEIKPFDKSRRALDVMHEEIGCDLVDIVALDDEIDAWVDDEGLLKSENPVHSVKFGDREYQLAGKIVLFSRDDEGNSIGLNSEQVSRVRQNLEISLIGITR